MAQVYGLTALGNINDLITPTETPEYRLGDIVVIEEKESIRPNVLAEYIYVRNILSSITVFAPYVILPTAIIEEEVIFGQAAPAFVTTFPIIQIGVPQVDFAEDFYGFVKIKGVATVILNGASPNIDIGNALELEEPNLALTLNSTDEAASCGLALEAVTFNGTEALVLLNGNKVSLTT